MKEKWLKGCGTALATPFLEDAPDYEAYRNLVARQLAAGVDFLVPLGSTAETPCLRDTEKRELLRILRLSPSLIHRHLTACLRVFLCGRALRPTATR